MSEIQPINNSIIFRFVENVTRSGRFKHDTDWGFYVPEVTLAEGDTCRVIDITHVGPKCTKVTVGDKAIIQPLMWTNQFIVDDVQYWKTDESKILGIVEIPNDSE